MNRYIYPDFMQGANTNHQGFSLPVRVYYEDTDAGGVVYHSNYINFFERARTEFMRSLDYELDELAEQQKILFVVRSIHCDYLLPAKFNDELFVSADIIEASKTRIHFLQKIMRKAENTSQEMVVLAEAKVMVVCVDTDKFKPKRLTPQILETLQRVV